MASSARFYVAALSAAGAALLLVGAGVLRALPVLSVEGPSLNELAAACGTLLPSLRPGTLLAIGVASAGLLVPLLAARSLTRQLVASRAVARIRRASSQAIIGGRAVSVLETAEPLAFCTGLIAPQIVLSSGAIDRLGCDELASVIAHEAAHARRRDPLRLMILTTVADALYFLPIARRLAARYATLAEIEADNAASATHGKAPLARALLAFSPETRHGVGLASERVDALLGKRSRLELGLGLGLGTLITITALGLYAFSARHAGNVEVGTATAETCLLVVLALPTLLGVLAFVASTARARSLDSG